MATLTAVGRGRVCGSQRASGLWDESIGRWGACFVRRRVCGWGLGGRVGGKSSPCSLGKLAGVGDACVEQETTSPQNG